VMTMGFAGSTHHTALQLFVEEDSREPLTDITHPSKTHDCPLLEGCNTVQVQFNRA